MSHLHESDEAIDSLYSFWPSNTSAASVKEASVSVQLTISGRQVTLTLHDADEARLLERLEQVIAKYPVAQSNESSQFVDYYSHRTNHRKESSPSSSDGFCSIHHVEMKLVTKNGASWYSHLSSDGWCKGKVKRNRR
jgi:hypothetical protein